MTQRKNSAHDSLHQPSLTTKRLAYTLPAQGLCLLSSVSLLSGGLVVAQTETSIDNIVPTIENAQPSAGTTTTVKKDIVIPEASPTPKFSSRRANLQQRLRKQEVAETKQTQTQSESSEPVFTTRQPKTRVATPRITPTKESEVKPQVAQTPKIAPSQDSEATSNPSFADRLPAFAKPSNNSNGVTANNIKDGNNTYIDPTDYSEKTGGTYQAPNSVILTERSSGCRTVLSSGQAVSGNACAKPSSSESVANAGKSAPSWLRKSQNAQVATLAPTRRLLATNNSRLENPVIGSGSVSKTAYNPNRFIPNPGEFIPTTTKVSETPLAPSGGTLPPPLAEGNLIPRESTVAYDIPLASVLPKIPYTNTIAYGAYGAYSGTGMMYPLAMPAPITSLFGWRIHPITGTQRFHAGTDLGAPMGTPILAAARGQVETANWVSGYGLTVILNHGSAEQTLYGHMSEILVQPGQWVEPGMVIGRVGSTGQSTGPHLHFEVRHLTQNGWVAVDPSVELQMGLSQLLNNSRTAQVTTREERRN